MQPLPSFLSASPHADAPPSPMAPAITGRSRRRHLLALLCRSLLSYFPAAVLRIRRHTPPIELAHGALTLGAGGLGGRRRRGCRPDGKRDLIRRVREGWVNRFANAGDAALEAAEIITVKKSALYAARRHHLAQHWEAQQAI